MSKTFLVTLKPVDKFFFGGDMTFAIPSEGDRKTANEAYSSYIIRSSRFPQQTSLLGMLRFLLLNDSKYFADGEIIKGDKVEDDVAKLIGPRSFAVSKERGNFGQIQDLSACFLIDKFNPKLPVRYSFASFDSEFESAPSDVTGVVNGKKISMPTLGGYSAKTGYTERLKGSDGKYRSISDVFVEDRRIGIARNIGTGKTDENSLFKQVGYRFNDYFKDKEKKTTRKIADWHFAFYVTVSDECDFLKFDGNVVSVGGDASQFVLRCKEVVSIQQKDQTTSLKVILQSPSYIKRSDLNKVTFFMSQIVPFRFMTTTVKDTKDYTLKSGYQRSCRYELYAPGSVFYFSNEKDVTEFKKTLESYEAFRQIGYNEYKYFHNEKDENISVADNCQDQPSRR